MTEIKVKRCHWGNTFAFDWQGLKFFGAGSFRGLSLSGPDVIIDCGADVQQNSEMPDSTGPFSRSRCPRIIRINWPDGGKPALTAKEWKAIIHDLQRTRAESCRETLNVLVCCVGGHGRTGTALAVIAALTGVAPSDPVLFIRKVYCRKAVETKPQCSYIKSIAKLARKNASSGSDFDSSCGSSLP